MSRFYKVDQVGPQTRTIDQNHLLSQRSKTHRSGRHSEGFFSVSGSCKTSQKWLGNRHSLWSLLHGRNIPDMVMTNSLLPSSMAYLEWVFPCKMVIFPSLMSAFTEWIQMVSINHQVIRASEGRNPRSWPKAHAWQTGTHWDPADTMITMRYDYRGHE